MAETDLPLLLNGDLHPPIGRVEEFFDPAIALDNLFYVGGDLPERVKRDTLPLPHPVNRENYMPDSHFLYWLFGLGDFINVVEAAKKSSLSPARVYDFGGSTGRVFRHFFCQAEGLEVWSSDARRNTHQWNQMNFPTDIRVFLNGLVPPLPLPDHFFDLVTAFSVFTHIDEWEIPWLLELRRILRPGGLAYVTIHDEVYWANMTDQVRKGILKSPNGRYLTLGAEMPAKRMAFHHNPQNHYACYVFHHAEHIRREWGRFFEVVDIVPKHHARQAVVTLTY